MSDSTGNPIPTTNDAPKPTPPKPGPPAQQAVQGADGAGADAATQPDGPKETDWKAMARKWEERAKRDHAAALRLAEIEESQKSAEQKAAEKIAAAEARIAEFETREKVAGWKAEVSKDTGVPIAALAGSTLEEIQAHAEILKPLITSGASGQANRGPLVPTEGTGQAGSRPSQLTREDLKTMTTAEVNKARKEGRMVNILRGL